MNNEMRSLFLESEGRYLTEDERKKIADYIEGFQARLAYAALIEEAEDGAVRFCIDNTRKRYPNFDKYHEKAWAKAFRDVQLTTRYAAQAMVLGDKKLLQEKLLHWLKTILAGLNFTPEFNRDTYTFLTEGFRQALPPDAFAEFEPYLALVIEILSDFPQPATPAV